jgi:predicted CoA-binding protein
MKFIQPSTLTEIQIFFRSKAYGVVGVSRNAKNFGHSLYRSLIDRGLTAYPVNPHADIIEGVHCFCSVADLPAEVTSVVISVKPDQTAAVIDDCAAKGVTALWLQQGSESPEAISKALGAKMTVIHHECLIMFLSPVKFPHSLHRWGKKITGSYPR